MWPLSQEILCVEKNQGGSSKTMEPAMSVNILNDIKEKGYGVRKTIMDDDTITIAKILRESIVQLRNVAILSKTLCTHCLSCRKTDRSKMSLSTTTISNIKQCFTYSFLKNKNDALGLIWRRLAV